MSSSTDTSIPTITATSTDTSTPTLTSVYSDTSVPQFIYPHTDNYFSGLSLMLQSISITVFILCAYLSIYVFKRRIFGIAYSLLALLGLLSQILLASYFLGKMDNAPNPYVIFSHWILLDLFNVGLTALKLQRLKIIQVGVTTKGSIIYYANIASAVTSFFGFTYNAMITFGPLSLLSVNPSRDNILVAIVVISRIFALVVDTPTAVYFKLYILGVKKFSLRKIQGLEVILVGIALYTVGIITVKYIQVTYASSGDKLLTFASAQFPATLGMFLAVQFLSILTSMENAKFAIMHGSKIGKTSGVASQKGGVSQKVTSKHGGEEVVATGVISTTGKGSKANGSPTKKTASKSEK